MVKSATLRLAVIIAVLACAVALAFAACGDHPTRSGGLQAADSLPTQIMGSLESAPPTKTSINDALAELDALVCPEGVDAALWGELKDALEEAFLSEEESRLSSRDLQPKESRLEDLPALAAGRDSLLKEQDGHPARAGSPYKQASTPPLGEANRVNDLVIGDNGDGTYTLTWHYRNLGDYGQDGKVGIEDITPIAQNFGVEVADHLIEGAAALEGPFSEVGTVSVDEPTGAESGRAVFEHAFTPGEYTYFRVTARDAAGIRGYNDGEP